MEGLLRDLPVPVGREDHRVVYSLRLHDELLDMMVRAGKVGSLVRVSLATNPSENALLIGDQRIPITRAHESQSVDVARLSVSPAGRQPQRRGQATLQITGSVRDKLLVRQELGLSKMQQVRQETETAERERHSRKTIPLEEGPTGLAKRRMVTNTPNRAVSSPAGKVGATPLRRPAFGSNVIKPMSDADSQDSWSTRDSVPAAELSQAKPVPSKTAASTPSRRSASSALLPPIAPHSAKDDTYHQLEEEFGRRYQEYLFLNSWVEQRLAVFKQIKDQLAADAGTGLEQLTFRLIVEEKRLREDALYQEKMDKLEEVYAALMMIKARLRELVSGRCAGRKPQAAS